MGKTEPPTPAFFSPVGFENLSDSTSRSQQTLTIGLDLAGRNSLVPHHRRQHSTRWRSVDSYRVQPLSRGLAAEPKPCVEARPTKWIFWPHTLAGAPSLTERWSSTSLGAPRNMAHCTWPFGPSHRWRAHGKRDPCFLLGLGLYPDLIILVYNNSEDNVHSTRRIPSRYPLWD